MSVNDLGTFLTDQCEQIQMKDLLDIVNQRLKLELLKSEIAINGLQVDIRATETGGGGRRYWFICPISGKKCAVLYRHPITDVIGSREALGLKYRKSAKKGMIEEKVFNS